MRKIIAGFILTGALASASVGFAAAPEWKVNLRVEDDLHSPLAGAEAFISYYVSGAPGEPEIGKRQAGLTDTNGFFGIVGRSGPFIWYGANKPGYYPTYNLQYEFKSQIANHWQPWEPTLEIRLRKVLRPIPMYAKRVKGAPPVDNAAVGYDLTVGDWVAPSGKGQVVDVLFTRAFQKRSQSDYETKLKVSFPNKGDGILEAPTESPLDHGSAFRSPYEAPLAGYSPELIRETSAHPRTGSKVDYDENRCYIFRVRTVLDPNGHVQTALYGKIYGDFMQFWYYLNPVQNDRNLEFDPSRNLFTDLISFERVSRP